MDNEMPISRSAGGGSDPRAEVESLRGQLATALEERNLAQNWVLRMVLYATADPINFEPLEINDPAYRVRELRAERDRLQDQLNDLIERNIDERIGRGEVQVFSDMESFLGTLNSDADHATQYVARLALAERDRDTAQAKQHSLEAEVERWRSYHPDDETLQVAKEQYAGGGRAAAGIYIGTLEARVTDLLDRLKAVRGERDDEFQIGSGYYFKWQREQKRSEAVTAERDAAQAGLIQARELLNRVSEMDLHDGMCEGNLVPGEPCNCGVSEFQEKVRAVLDSTSGAGGAK